MTEMADLEVLAKLAAQIAPGEEDGTTSTPATQASLLAMMGKITIDFRVAARLTDACLTEQPVLMECAGTDLTGCQALDRVLSPLL